MNSDFWEILNEHFPHTFGIFFRFLKLRKTRYDNPLVFDYFQEMLYSPELVSMNDYDYIWLASYEKHYHIYKDNKELCIVTSKDTAMLKVFELLEEYFVQKCSKNIRHHIKPKIYKEQVQIKYPLHKFNQHQKNKNKKIPNQWDSHINELMEHYNQKRDRRKGKKYNGRF